MKVNARFQESATESYPRDQWKSILAINYYFSEEDLGNRIFEDDSRNYLAPGLRRFRDFMAKRGVKVVTLDTVDFADRRVKAVLYFDYNWRFDRTDRFLDRIPFEKRALVLLEPAMVNPSMYYTNHWRKKFKTVFTWDLKLLKKNPAYVRIDVPPGADPARYRQNPFPEKVFDRKKFLVAVSSNRWSYWPQSTFPLRRKVYRFMHKELGDDFDLFGHDWDRPCSRIEKLLGRTYGAWRGEIPGSWDEKIAKISGYKFMICFENNCVQPGYVSEKIFDCFCARTVPIYYGYRGAEDLLPEGGYVNFRDFKSLRALLDYLKGVSASDYSGFIASINEYMAGDYVGQRTNETLYGRIYETLLREGRL